MALATNVQDLATRVATEAKSLRTLLNGNEPNLSQLQTTAKTSLVAAINELVGAVGGAGASIDDGSTSAVSVWSSLKTSTEISDAVTALVGGAPGALDTLIELAAALGDDPNFATTITNMITDATKPATEESRGTVELATTAEALTGTDTTRAITPAVLRSITGDSTVNFVLTFENGLEG